MRRIIALTTVVALASAFAMAGMQQAKVGSAAPDFSAKDPEGKTHTLTSLTEKGDLFLYFIKEDCPVNADAVKYFNQLGKAYDGKAVMVGVFNGDAARFKSWNARHKATYPMLLDPDHKIIQDYKATASPWMIRVSKEKIAKVWPGYSSKDLEEMNDMMATSGNAKKAALDLKGAPKDTAFG